MADSPSIHSTSPIHTAETTRTSVTSRTTRRGSTADPTRTAPASPAPRRGAPAHGPRRRPLTSRPRPTRATTCPNLGWRLTIHERTAKINPGAVHRLGAPHVPRSFNWAAPGAPTTARFPAHSHPIPSHPCSRSRAQLSSAHFEQKTRTGRFARPSLRPSLFLRGEEKQAAERKGRDDGTDAGGGGGGAAGGGGVRGAAVEDGGEQDQHQLEAQHQLLRLGDAAQPLLQGRLARVLLHGGAGGRGAGGRDGVQQVRLQQRHLQLQQGPQLRVPAQRDQDLLLHLQLRLLLRRDAPRHQGGEAAAAVPAAVRQPQVRRRRIRQVPRRGPLRSRRRARRAPQDGLVYGNSGWASPFVRVLSFNLKIFFLFFSFHLVFSFS